MNNEAEQPIEETTQVRRMPLFALFAANTISFVGDALMLIAIPWFVLQTIGSAARGLRPGPRPPDILARSRWCHRGGCP